MSNYKVKLINILALANIFIARLRYSNKLCISTHSLRHTYCTRCIEAGLEPIVIATLLGQSDIDMVYEVYTDIQEKFKTGELFKVDKYYKNKNLMQDNVELLGNKDNER